MNVLIVYAHPEPRSFNGAMRDAAVETLAAAGHAVEVSDLYAMDFRAVVGPDDFLGERVDPQTLRIPAEQTRAFETGTLAPDILAEQDKLRRADLVILQFPLWWFGMPAILKGWADRVVARGFACAAGRKYDAGLLRDKTAMVAVTTGTSADAYAPDGVDGDILNVLWPIHNGLFRYPCFDVFEPFVACMPGRLGLEARAACLEACRDRLRNLARARKLFFHPAADYGANERLKPGVAARSGVQRNV
ncbi:MAG: NAD(P)H-dependent oxidoreductase [Roseiarcus sp.]